MGCGQGRGAAGPGHAAVPGPSCSAPGASAPSRQRPFQKLRPVVGPASQAECKCRAGRPRRCGCPGSAPTPSVCGQRHQLLPPAAEQALLPTACGLPCRSPRGTPARAPQHGPGAETPLLLTVTPPSLSLAGETRAAQDALGPAVARPFPLGARDFFVGRFYDQRGVCALQGI